MPNRTPRVLLSYAAEDASEAHLVANHLRQHGVDLWLDQVELQAGDSIAGPLAAAIQASDYVVVLLTGASVQSKWVAEELAVALDRELHRRDVVVFPVLLEDDVEVPIALQGRHILRIDTSRPETLADLVAALQQVPLIDWGALNPRQFEHLIADLLRAVGFENVRLMGEPGGQGVDIAAEFTPATPFGQSTRQRWMVQAKLYRRERASLGALRDLIGALELGVSEYTNALLVTNGQLTSVGQRYLAAFEDSQPGRVKVLDGPILKRLLLDHPQLVEAFAQGQR